MGEQSITLKTINELRLEVSGEPRRFFIASYQRGYRWTPLQVSQLLEDLREFTRRPNPKPEEFYCLQPLVLKPAAAGCYEVVDGQQRLTTLLLVLRHFNERLANKYQQVLYAIDYETRPAMETFLEEPTPETANSNVDFFHIYKAIETIGRWFGEHDNEVEEIKSALLNRTKVIWFELADGDNAVEAFTRLNVGKIPLTNDELIRALFLRRSGPDDSDAAHVQMRIAYEWDQFEKSLQSDAFWFFLSNRPWKDQNRIGFLFDLIARSEGLFTAAKNDAYGVFYTFSERLKAAGSTPEGEWKKIVQTYLMLEEWFEDRTLFHMVGFLVSEGISLNTIRMLSVDCAKSAFDQRLRQEIFDCVIGGTLPEPPDEQAVQERVAERLDVLSYNHPKIRSVLLLFNLATLLQNNRSNIRFQFDSFKSERWDIEHVRSVADDKPERFHDRRDWLQNCLGYLESQAAPAARLGAARPPVGPRRRLPRRLRIRRPAAPEKALCIEIKAFLELTQVGATNEVFDPLYERVLQVFGEASEVVTGHGIANLALLDERTNRSYKNAVFAVKRKRILDLDQAGIFVPLCTRNVFLKCYSPQVNNVIFWGEVDQDGYKGAIVTTLTKFFCGRTGGVL